jgi:tripartite-type tricarboxylate transporter receptor subunit TctC
MGTTTTHAIAPAAFAKLAYDPVADFEPIALVANAPYLLVVQPSFPAKDLKEFVAAVKAQPGQVQLRLRGPGDDDAPRHGDAREQGGARDGAHPVQGQRARDDRRARRPDRSPLRRASTALPHVAAGKLRPLAISSAKRSTSLPDVPTVAEQGFPGYDMALWLGFFAPKGTPPAILKRLETELLHVAQSAELKDALQKQGLEPYPVGTAELAPMLKAEIETYKMVFKAANIPVQ